MCTSKMKLQNILLEHIPGNKQKFSYLGVYFKLELTIKISFDLVSIPSHNVIPQSPGGTGRNQDLHTKNLSALCSSFYFTFLKQSHLKSSSIINTIIKIIFLIKKLQYFIGNSQNLKVYFSRQLNTLNNLYISYPTIMKNN